MAPLDVIPLLSFFPFLRVDAFLGRIGKRERLSLGPYSLEVRVAVLCTVANQDAPSVSSGDGSDFSIDVNLSRAITKVNMGTK